MSDNTLRLTLLGTGSSGGVPRIGNDWGACDPAEPKNRRRRCSALVELFRPSGEADATRVLIDTSPDLREQLLSCGIESLDAVFMTHDHADQSHGIDDLRALALRARAQIPIYMDSETADTLVHKFNYCFEGTGGYPPILDLQPLLVVGKTQTVVGNGGPISMQPVLQIHGRINSLGFRIGNLAYCNDVSELPEITLDELHGLDLFIVDALRYTPHPTHAHLEQTLEWVSKLRPKRTVLTNLHIDMDYRTLLNDLPEGVEPGYDGLSIEIPF